MSRNWASFRPGSLPVVSNRVSRTIIRALVDTGAAISLVHPTLVACLDLATIGSTNIVSIGSGVIAAPLVSIHNCALGNQTLAPFEAVIVDLSNLQIGIELILGINSASL